MKIRKLGDIAMTVLVIAGAAFLLFVGATIVREITKACLWSWRQP